MRDFAEGFYKSKAWQNTRDAYMRSVGCLCENCLQKGIYKPAEIVHHRVHIETFNVNNPEVTLSWDNLQALCRGCHGKAHEDYYRKNKKRFSINEEGKVIGI